MDLRMPGVDGIQLTRLVKDRLPSCKVLIFTLYDQYVAEARKAGASGYLLKDSTLEELVDAIQRVYGGEEVIDEKIRPAVEIDYQAATEQNTDFRVALAGSSTENAVGSLFDQARVFMLPPADIAACLRLTSVLEEALAGEFKQVDGTLIDGISVTFNLSRSLSSEELSIRISSISGITIVDYYELTQIGDLQNIMKKQQQYDARHPSVKTVFIRLAP